MKNRIAAEGLGEGLGEVAMAKKTGENKNHQICKRAIHGFIMVMLTKDEGNAISTSHYVPDLVQ